MERGATKYTPHWTFLELPIHPKRTTDKLLFGRRIFFQGLVDVYQPKGQETDLLAGPESPGDGGGCSSQGESLVSLVTCTELRDPGLESRS